MEGTLCFGVLIVAIVLILWAWSSDQRRKQEELMAAKNAYEKALVELKRRPNDPNVKQKTLALGRLYSNLTRDKKGVTVFDEMALMNDINAACAAATASKPIINVPTESAEQRLLKLLDLKGKNLITDEEYTHRRQRILDEI